MNLNEETRNKLNALVRMLRDRTMTKSDVMDALDVCERTARQMLAEVAKRCPVVAVSDKTGYRIATVAQDMGDAMHAYNENKKRAAEILKRNAPLTEFIQKHGGVLS